MLCHLDAWSGPDGGPWKDRPGYDDLVQAATGIMARFGGGLETPEEHAHFGTIDVLGGLCGAFSAALALYARDRAGEVTVARTSLAAAGQLIQAPFMYDYESRPPWDEPAGRDARGESPTHSLYRAADGWMFVAVSDGETRSAALRSMLQLNDPESLSREDLHGRDGGAIHALPVNEWRRRLEPHGVSIQPLQTLAQVRAEHTSDRDQSPPWSSSSFLFTSDRQSRRWTGSHSGRADRGEATQCRRQIPSDRRSTANTPTPSLQRLGYSRKRSRSLLSRGVAARQWSDAYLPS